MDSAGVQTSSNVEQEVFGIESRLKACSQVDAVDLIDTLICRISLKFVFFLELAAEIIVTFTDCRALI